MDKTHPTNLMAAALTGVLLALLVVAAPVRAEQYPERQPGYRIVIHDDRPATNPIVNQLVAIAERFWDARNVHGNRPDLRFGDEMTFCYQRGSTEICQDANEFANPQAMWLDSTLVGIAQSERWAPHSAGDSFREDLCATIIHGIGHVRGLEHQDSGVMSYDGTVPWDCKKWRRAQDRRQKKASRMLRRHR